jgi:hypothetical protein
MLKEFVIIATIMMNLGYMTAIETTMWATMPPLRTLEHCEEKRPELQALLEKEYEGKNAIVATVCTEREPQGEKI